jgi:hypothetical protein
MSRTTSLLALVARINPAIWDAIHPMGPITVGHYRHAFGAGREVADELNPQPLPPAERAAVRRQLLHGAVQLSGQLAQLAVFSQAQNGNGAELLVREVDDWCGNQPRPIPWPTNWPIPIPDPDPWPWLSAEVFAAAAVTLAGIADRLGEGELRDGFDKAVDRLSEAAIGG